MPGVNEVLDYELDKAEADAVLDKADWLFCLDFNHFSRTKTMAAKLFSLSIPKILIDHHEEPDEAAFAYGNSNPGKSSTCEMIYDLIVNPTIETKSIQHC